MKIFTGLIASVALLIATGVAAADIRVTATPRTADPGAAVLITVTGAKDMPEGKAGSTKLHFFAARGGHQAVAAIPLDHKPGSFEVEIKGAAKASVVKVRERVFSEASIVVEEEMASPDAPDRDRIDADNHAIRGAFAKATGAPQFTGKFIAPGRGKVTSTYGEWRTFNDGHRSQHLGHDIGAREGSTVKAAGGGTVTLVRECFLAGNVVVLDHGAGIATAYFHLAATTVKDGDKVKAGAKIGTVGKTGRTTGPHLHLSVWTTDGFVDPASFLKLALRPAKAKAGATKAEKVAAAKK
jgi:murein DD-endopeptidase MepM/ murein hydrolase activator NlpD